MIERRYTGEKPKTRLPKGTIDTQLHIYETGFPAMPGGSPIPAGLPDFENYQKVMQWLGIERFVITQANAHQCDNSNLMSVLALAGKIARGVAVIEENTSDDELEQLDKAGVKGARIMDLLGGAVGIDRIHAIDEKTSAINWMMAVQFDGSNLIDLFPKLKDLKSNWVLDHHGKFFKGITPNSPEVDHLKKLIDGGNCWFKFAGCYESSLDGQPYYKDIAAVAQEIAKYAPERIIWGTNFPHNQAQTTEEYPDDAALLDTVMCWFPDEKSQKLALVDNPQELFQFNA